MHAAAFGCLAHALRCRSLSLCPGKVPLAAHIWPPMTTVGWPIREMGKAAALKLVAPDTAEAKPSCFPARLVTRNSVAPPS